MFRVLAVLTTAVLCTIALLRSGPGGAVLRTVQVGIGPTALAVAEPSGRVFVAGGALNDGVEVLDGATGTPLRHVALSPVTSDAIGGAWAFGPATATELTLQRPDNTIVALDARSGAAVRIGVASTPGVQVLPRARQRGAVTFDPARRLLAGVASGGIAWRLPLAAGSVPRAASSALDRIYVSTADGDVKLVDARTGRLLGAAGVPNALGDQGRVTLDLAVSKSSAHLFVLRGFEGGNTLTMLDARTGRLLTTVRHSAGYIDVTAYFPRPRPLCYVDEHSGMLATASLEDDMVRLYDTRSGRQVHAIRLAAHPSSWAIDPVRQLLLIASTGPTVGFDYPTGDGTLSAIDLRSGALRRTIRIGAEPIAVAVDPRTARAFVLNANVNPDFTPLLARRAAWWVGPLGWLSDRLPFLPRPGSVDAGTVTVVDTDRL